MNEWPIAYRVYHSSGYCHHHKTIGLSGGGNNQSLPRNLLGEPRMRLPHIQAALSPWRRRYELTRGEGAPPPCPAVISWRSLPAIQCVCFVFSPPMGCYATNPLPQYFRSSPAPDQCQWVRSTVIAAAAKHLGRRGGSNNQSLLTSAATPSINPLPQRIRSPSPGRGP
jgi:hypothetical protein